MFEGITDYFKSLVSDEFDLDRHIKNLSKLHVNLYAPDQANIARVTMAFKANEEGLSFREQCSVLATALRDKQLFPSDSPQLKAFCDLLADIMSQLDAIDMNPEYEAKRTLVLYNEKSLYLPKPFWFDLQR